VHPASPAAACPLLSLSGVPGHSLLFTLRAPLLSRVLKNSLLPRLLKKVQMQGGVRGEVRGVLSSYVAAPRERGGTHRRWVSAGGPFSAAC
jgi:hypothetical protein